MTTDAAPENESLASQTVRGVAWMMLLKLTVRGLGLISTLILVRLLTPEDFGLVAMAMVFIEIMEVFAWFSFDVVLIQRQSSSRDDYDTAWTFQLLFKCVSAVVLLGIAWPASLYYQEPRVTAIVLALSAGVFISGFENIGIVNFRKNMQFNKDFMFMFLRKFAGFCVTIPLAFVLRNYWALIAGILTGRIIAVFLSYSMEPHRPRFCLKSHAELFGFSKWLFINNILFALRARGADLIIGRIAGSKALGLFSVSYEISNLPTTELVAPINRAVFPSYAKISSSLDNLRRGYLNVISLIALFAVPAGLGIAATAELIVPVALGSKWLDATPLIAILGFYGVVSALQTNIASAYLALGRPQVLTALFGLHLAVLIAVAIPATSQHGIVGAAWAYLGTALALLPLNYAVMFRTIRLRLPVFLERMWRPLVAAGIMYAAVKTLSGKLMMASAGEPHLLHFLLAVSAGVVVYLVVIALFWLMCGRPDGAETYVLNAVKHRLEKRKAKLL